MNARLAAVALAALLAACASAPPAVRDAVPTQPEGASGHLAKPGWSARTFAVAAANPLAAEAGVQMLRAGGSAVDAAIAVQMVLTLVEPQSSGIGGGAFLLHYDGRVVEAFDGRETAPAAADENLFVGADGKPMPFLDARRRRALGRRARRACGCWRWRTAQHGRLAWSELFQPAIALAEDGFAVSPRLHALLAAEQSLRSDPVAAAYFYAPGRPAVAERAPAAATPSSRRCCARSPPAVRRRCTRARWPQAIVAKVRDHPTNPGRLALADLAGYQPKQRDALCFDYPARPRRTFVVCGFPPPSSGAIAIGQILGILNEHRGHAPLAARQRRPRRRLAAPLHRGGAPGLRRPRPVRRRPRLRRPAGRRAGRACSTPDYLAAARHADRPAARCSGRRPATPAASGPATRRMPDQPEYGTSHISIVDG